MTTITLYMSGHLKLDRHSPRNSRDRAWDRLTFVPTGDSFFFRDEPNKAWPTGVERFLRDRAGDPRGDGPYSADDARQVFNANANLNNWDDRIAAPRHGTVYVPSDFDR